MFVTEFIDPIFITIINNNAQHIYKKLSCEISHSMELDPAWFLSEASFPKGHPFTRETVHDVAKKGSYTFGKQLCQKALPVEKR